MSYASVVTATTVETGSPSFAISILAARCSLFRIADVRNDVGIPSKLLTRFTWRPPTPARLTPLLRRFCWRGLCSCQAGTAAAIADV